MLLQISDTCSWILGFPHIFATALAKQLTLQIIHRQSDYQNKLNCTVMSSKIVSPSTKIPTYIQEQMCQEKLSSKEKGKVL